MKKSEGLTSKALETRDRILHCALDLFKEKGFDNTTMRDIAQRAGVALGAAYYYFKTKDELVLHFYGSLQAEASGAMDDIVTTSADFQRRFRRLLRSRIEQLGPYRNLVTVLARNSTEPANPLSPFSPQTRAVREEAIRMVERCISGSNLRVAPSVAPHLSKLLWFYQMGILFFWAHDNSARQQRTGQLIDHSLSLLVKLLPLSRLPFMRTLNQSVVKLIHMVEELGSEEPQKL